MSLPLRSPAPACTIVLNLCDHPPRLFRAAERDSTWFSTGSFKIVNPASCSSLCQQFLQVHLRPRRQISASLTGPALIHDSRQSLVRPDRRILKLPRLLPRRWRSLPLELPCESSRKRSGDDTQGVPGKLGILLGGFRESKAVQLRVDLNRLHAIIIPSQMENGGIREVWKIGPSRRLWGNGSGMLWWQ